MPSTYETLVRDLDAQSFHKMPITCSRAEIETAVKAFFRFMELPEATKRRFAFKLEDYQGQMEMGYWTRSRAEGKADNREYFHYDAAADEAFRKTGADCPELITFMDAAKIVYQATVPTLREAVQIIDEVYPGIEKKIFEPGSGRFLQAPIRFLGYPNTDPGDFLASGHYDKGIVTLAIAESAPGLRIGKTPDTVQDVIHEEGYGLFFPAIQLEPLTNPHFVPSWHDVIQKDQDTFTSDYSRWAVVLFFAAWDERATTWEDRHKPKY